MTGIKLTFIFLSGLTLGYGIRAWQSEAPSQQLASHNGPYVNPTREPLLSSRPVAKEGIKTSAGASNPAVAIKDIMSAETPTLREIKLTALGLEAARKDLDSAMTAIGVLQDSKAKMAYLRGVFSHIAETKTPYQAIARARGLDQWFEVKAMEILVSEWTGQEVLDKSLSGISRAFLRSDQISYDVKASWLKAFDKHALQGAMSGTLAAQSIGDDPEAAMAMGADLAGWQQQQFLNQFVSQWAEQNPNAALKWAKDNTDQLPPNAVSQLVAGQYAQHAEAALDLFDALQDPQQRRRAVIGITEEKANREGTQAAIEWADSLTDSAERDAAHDRLYQVTPRGIGAMLSVQDGLPVISQTIAGTPAEAAGLQNGDRIVEVDDGSGQFVPSGALQSTVDLIRGEPGTALKLRILRDGANGQLEEHVIDLNRQQLVFPGPKNL